MKLVTHTRKIHLPQVGTIYKQDFRGHILGKTPKEKINPTLEAADETLDLLNNRIGRAIGKDTKGAPLKQIALKVLNYFRNVGLWVGSDSTDNKGLFTGVSFAQTKLTYKEYQDAVNLLNSLNDQGFTEEEWEAYLDRVKTIILKQRFSRNKIR